MIEIVEKVLDIANSKKEGGDNKKIGDTTIKKVVLVSDFFDNHLRVNLNYGLYKFIATSLLIFYFTVLIDEYIIQDKDYNESLYQMITNFFVAIGWYSSFILGKIISIVNNCSIGILLLLKAILYTIWKILYVNNIKEFDIYFIPLWNWFETVKDFKIPFKNIFELSYINQIRLHSSFIITFLMYQIFVVQYYCQRLLFFSKFQSYYVPIFFMKQFFNRKKNKKVRLFLLAHQTNERLHQRGVLTYAMGVLFNEYDDKNYELQYETKSIYFSIFSVVDFLLVKKENKNGKI